MSAAQSEEEMVACAQNRATYTQMGILPSPLWGDSNGTNISNRDQALRAMLSKHPAFSQAEIEIENHAVHVAIANQRRTLKIGDPSEPLYGLLELMDNNPIVCADHLSIGSLASSAFLIALGPLLLSGLVTEPHTFVTNLPLDPSEISRAALSVGWTEEIAFTTEEAPVEGVVLATGMAVIRTIPDLEEIAELYHERFDKSLLIREATLDQWFPASVEGHPLALYRITIHADEPTSFASIQIMADRTGALEAAQILTAMNVMYGLGDDLGLTDPTP